MIAAGAERRSPVPLPPLRGRGREPAAAAPSDAGDADLRPRPRPSDAPYQRSSNAYTLEPGKDDALLAEMRAHWTAIGGVAASGRRVDDPDQRIFVRRSTCTRTSWTWRARTTRSSCGTAATRGPSRPRCAPASARARARNPRARTTRRGTTLCITPRPAPEEPGGEEARRGGEEAGGVSSRTGADRSAVDAFPSSSATSTSPGWICLGRGRGSACGTSRRGFDTGRSRACSRNRRGGRARSRTRRGWRRTWRQRESSPTGRRRTSSRTGRAEPRRPAARPATAVLARTAREPAPALREVLLSPPPSRHRCVVRSSSLPRGRARLLRAPRVKASSAKKPLSNAARRKRARGGSRAKEEPRTTRRRGRA